MLAAIQPAQQTALRVPLTQLIAPSFYELHHEIKADRYDEYWLKGGRGSTKSTFISIEILLGMLRDPDANAVVFRRYQNELRDSVFGQVERSEERRVGKECRARWAA